MGSGFLYQRACIQFAAPAPDSSFLLKQILKGNKGVSNSGLSATHVEDLVEFQAFCSDCGQGLLGSDPIDRSLLFVKKREREKKKLSVFL